jgi:hypothetical protein
LISQSTSNVFTVSRLLVAVIVWVVGFACIYVIIPRFLSRSVLTDTAGTPVGAARVAGETAVRIPSTGTGATHRYDHTRVTAACKQKRSEQSRRYRERVKERKPPEKEVIPAARVITKNSFRRLLRSTRLLEADERTKAAIYGLNRVGGRTRELEEAWIIQALVREDGMSQVEVAELLGRHKSWVCRRLALIERLGPKAKDDLRVGLLSPTAARQVVRL